MYCPKCGKEVEENDKFCWNCSYELTKKDGAPITKDMREKAMSEKKTSWKSMFLGAIIGLIFAGGMGEIYSLFTGEIPPTIPLQIGGLLSFFIGCLIAGYMSTNDASKHGLGAGIIFLLIASSASFLIGFYDNLSILISSLFIDLVLVIIIGPIGGYIGGKIKNIR